MKNKRILMGMVIFFGVVAILLIHLLFVYKTAVIKNAEKGKTVYQMGNSEGNTGEILAGTEVKQVFKVRPQTGITGIKLYFATYGRKSNSHLEISLKELPHKGVLGEWSVDAASLKDGEGVELALDKRAEAKEAVTLEVSITSKDGQSGQAVTLACSSGKPSKGSLLSVDGKTLEGELFLNLTDGKQNYLIPYFFLTALALLVILAAVWWFGAAMKWEMHRIFLILGAGLGLVYIFVLPPYSAPDEAAHFNTAYYYSNILMGKEPADKDGLVLLRREESLLSPKEYKPGARTYGIVAENLFASNQRGTETATVREPLSGVPWFVYTPQILAVTIARLLNIGNIGLFMLGRIFALAFYLFCGYFAVKLMPFAKSLMVMIPLLPIALELGASFSYDSMINGVCFLFVAYCLNLIYKKPSVEKKDWICLSALSILLAPCKIVYLLLTFLVFLIPSGKAVSKKNYRIGTWAVVGAGILSLAAVRIVTMATYLTRQENTLSYAYTAGFTVGDILKSPLYFLQMLYNTFWVKGTFYFNSMLGGTLGWLEIGISMVWITIIFLLLFLSVQTVHREKAEILTGRKFFFGGIILSVVGALMGVFLLTWTPSDSQTIEGVQGRYFLPVLPLIMLLFRGKWMVFKENMDRKIVMAFGLVQFFVVWEAFRTIIER